MRIVIIADSIDTQHAGIHVYTRNMIESLEKLSGQDIICIRQRKGSPIKFRNDIVVPSVFPFLLKDPFRLFFKIPNAIKKLNPDIVIEPAHFGPFNLPGKIKRITVIHDLTPIMFPEWHNFISRNLQKVFLPSILKRSSLIITNSENTSKDIRETYPFIVEKIVRIYPGIDPFFKIKKEEIIQHKEPFFLSVGTIEPRKNLSLLLDSYQFFREKTNLTHQLIICGGKGWKNKDFHKRLSNHPFKNDIKLMGYVGKEELKKLYSTTTAFIYPSLYEGFGFPVVEAMGCGAPCIVSNSSSLPEVGSDAVLYFDSFHPEELANHLQNIAESDELKQKLSHSGNFRSSVFTVEHFSNELEKILLALK